MARIKPWSFSLLGLRPDDPRLPDSFALAAEQGMAFGSILWNCALRTPIPLFSP